MDSQISLDELLKVTEQDIEIFKQCMTVDKCSYDQNEKYKKTVVFSIEVKNGHPWLVIEPDVCQILCLQNIIK